MKRVGGWLGIVLLFKRIFGEQEWDHRRKPLQITLCRKVAWRIKKRASELCEKQHVYWLCVSRVCFSSRRFTLPLFPLDAGLIELFQSVIRLTPSETFQTKITFFSPPSSPRLHIWRILRRARRRLLAPSKVCLFFIVARRDMRGTNKRQKFNFLNYSLISPMARAIILSPTEA